MNENAEIARSRKLYMAEMYNKAPDEVKASIDFSNQLREVFIHAKNEGSLDYFKQWKETIFGSKTAENTQIPSIKQQLNDINLKMTILEADLLIYQLNSKDL